MAPRVPGRLDSQQACPPGRMAPLLAQALALAPDIACMTGPAANLALRPDVILGARCRKVTEQVTIGSYGAVRLFTTPCVDDDWESVAVFGAYGADSSGTIALLAPTQFGQVTTDS